LRRWLFYGGVFVTCASVMMLQVIETRLLSVMSHYYLAFLSISMAMFGMTAGAVWVYFQSERFTRESLPHNLARFASWFSVSIVASLLLQISHAPVQVASATMLVLWTELALILAAPFFLAGVVVSLALTRSHFPVGQVYAADMIGASLGCLGVLGLLEVFDAPSALLVIASTAAIAASLFARSAGALIPPAGDIAARFTGRPITLALVLSGLAILNASTVHGLQPALVKDKVDNRFDVNYEKWNTYSRVRVGSPWTGWPFLWGASETMPPALRVQQRSLNIDGDAGTVMFRFAGNADEASFLKYDVTNVAYSIRNTGRAAIIGVGGGRDVLSAWYFGFRDITGVELNPIFIDLLTRRQPFAAFAGLVGLPGIHFYVDEARSWFARTQNRFDLIQMSMIDTWAATGAGAYSLSENGLYTLEGWRHFVGALTETGVFTVSRWYATGKVDETGRMVSLAARVLMDFGIADPESHLALIANENLATLILSRQPLTAAELAKLHRLADEMKFTVILAPDARPASPLLSSIVSAHNPTQLTRITSGLRFDLTPPTDDRPFFFNQLPLAQAWREAFDLDLYRATGVRGGNLLASLALLSILVVAVVLVITVIVLPLRPAIRETNSRLALFGSAYFLLLGIAFMFVEIALLQCLSLFLGHPVYSLSIVLFAIILSTGLGSLLSGRFVPASHPAFPLWAMLLAAYIVSLAVWAPSIIAAGASNGIMLRGATAVAIIAPAGLLMGFGFPEGMRMVLEQNPKPAPWFWGINGAAGVLGSILAVAIGITFGIKVTLFLGAACYAMLVPAAMMLRGGSYQRLGMEVPGESGKGARLP
jgi:hypothetical protein